MRKIVTICNKCGRELQEPAIEERTYVKISVYGAKVLDIGRGGCWRDG